MAIEEILSRAGDPLTEMDCVTSSSQGEVLHFLKTLAAGAGPSITFLLVMPTWPACSQCIYDSLLLHPTLE